MFDGNFREAADKVTGPIGQSLHRIGVSADVITVIGVGMAAACGAFIATGRFFTAVVLLALTGLPDALDGAVAKASGSSGPRGAFFDSVSDRLSDGLLFFGASWYFLGSSTPQLAMLPFALYLAASLVSYQRAKAESLGFDAKGGLMERAERFIVLGAGLLFAPLHQHVFSGVLWVMLVLTVITVGTRFAKVWKQASAVTPRAVTPRRPTGSPRAERIRARREARAASVDELRSMARERMSSLRK